MEQDHYAQLFWQGMKNYVNHQQEINQPVQSGMEDYLVLSRDLLDDYKRQAQARYEEIAIAAIEAEVTCTLWYGCDKCKSLKKAIAILKNIGEINDNHNKDTATATTGIG